MAVRPKVPQNYICIIIEQVCPPRQQESFAVGGISFVMIKTTLQIFGSLLKMQKNEKKLQNR